jgi:CO/xanthine dehydrogenase FAD-binding subunit
MVLPRFEYIAPKSIDEVCSSLASLKDKEVAILAGGTDLLVDMRKQILPEHMPRCSGCPSESSTQRNLRKKPEYVISISGISGLGGFKTDGDFITIGSMNTISEICDSIMCQINFEALVEGCSSLGSPLVRNRATIGGNIAQARPSADTFVPTIALGGKILISSIRGNKEVPSESFATGPGETVLLSDEIITGIKYKKPTKNSGSSFIKLTNRNAVEIAIVSAAAYVVLSENLLTIESVRISLGSVGPTPILANKVMEFLLGKTFNDKVLNEASELAVKDTKPITDHRGSSEYRLDMVKTITKRVLETAINRVKQNCI